MHIGLILTLAFIIFKKSSSHLFEHHPCLYLLAFGMVVAKISNKLVVSFTSPGCCDNTRGYWWLNSYSVYKFYCDNYITFPVTASQ